MGYQSRGAKPARNHSFAAMGTDCRLVLTGRYAEQAAQQVQSEAWRIENKYSRYQPGSVLSSINRAALSDGDIDVDEETAALLNYAFTAYHLSDGLFDITSGVLRRVWNFSSSSIPSQSSIDSILPLVGLHQVEWLSHKLRFKRPEMELDFGGIGKEYAVDRCTEICLSMGMQSGLIDFGGDIRVFGGQPNGLPWEIWLKDPFNPKASLGKISLVSGAVATSGGYERYIEVDGKRYCHILNPKTGYPVNKLASVTVVAEQCLLAGTLATVALLKEDGGAAWLKSVGANFHWVDCKQNQGGNLLAP